MGNIYHDVSDPQLDAVERYYKVDLSEIGDESNEKYYHLYFLRSQIIGDVESQLMIVTRGRKKEGSQDNDLDVVEKFGNQFNRWIDKYVSLSKKPLVKYVVEDSVSGVTNIVDRGDEIDIRLSVGDWWNECVLKMLNIKIHDYIVNGLLYEYLLLYFGGKDDLVQSKQKDLELIQEEVKNLMLSYKSGKLRKSFHPFP